MTTKTNYTEAPYSIREVSEEELRFITGGAASGEPSIKLNYTTLQDVLDRAWQQAACGKGAERHGQSLPFDKQPMQTISCLLNTQSGMLYQAIKKIQESTRMDHDAAIRELLGAINYVAGAIIWSEKQNGTNDR